MLLLIKINYVLSVKLDNFDDAFGDPDPARPSVPSKKHGICRSTETEETCTHNPQIVYRYLALKKLRDMAAIKEYRLVVHKK